MYKLLKALTSVIDINISNSDGGWVLMFYKLHYPGKLSVRTQVVPPRRSVKAQASLTRFE